MKINKFRPVWDKRFKLSKKYNYFMDEFDLAEKIVDIIFNIYGKVYRYFEIKAIIFIERNFDPIQRKQLLVSKYLFKFMVLICFIFYIGTLFVWDYNARTQKLLIPTVKAKSETIIKEEIKPDYSITELVDYIHLMESSRGYADSGLSVVCKDKGLTNEYGYRAMDAWVDGYFNPDKAFCFNNQAEAVLTVTEWVKKYVEKYGTYEAMCIYNTGSTKNGNCEYVEILKSWKAN